MIEHVANCVPEFVGAVGTDDDSISAQLVANVTIVYSVFAAIADLIFGTLPIFVIWDLKMNKKAKMIVGGLLMLGILSVPLPSF